MSDAREALPLTESEQRELEGLLVAKLDALGASRGATAAEAQPVDLDTPIGRLTRMDAIQQQQMAEARRRRDDLLELQVHAAIERLRAGTYGTCLRCEEPIGFARLRARPEATLCLDCQDHTDRRR